MTKRRRQAQPNPVVNTANNCFSTAKRTLMEFAKQMLEGKLRHTDCFQGNFMVLAHEGESPRRLQGTCQEVLNAWFRFMDINPLRPFYDTLAEFREAQMAGKLWEHPQRMWLLKEMADVNSHIWDMPVTIDKP